MGSVPIPLTRCPHSKNKYSVPSVLQICGYFYISYEKFEGILKAQNCYIHDKSFLILIQVTTEL
jgi:hypothetical protein